MSRKLHKYILVKTVTDQTDVDEWISGTNCLTFLSHTETKNAETDYFRCSLVTRSVYKNCPVRAKVEYMNDSSEIRIYFTTWEHTHQVDGEKMPKDIKDEIIHQRRHGCRPYDIFESVKEKFKDRFHYNISQIRHVIRNHVEKTVAPAIDVGDLISWVIPMNHLCYHSSNRLQRKHLI